MDLWIRSEAKMTFIQYYWFVLTISILILTSYHDLKSRLIPDKYWLLLIIFGIPSFIYWFASTASTDAKILATINIIMSLIISFLLFFMGSFGGGDSKALILLAFTTPITIYDGDFSFLQLNPLPTIFVILFFLLIYFLLFALLLLLRNIIEITKYGPLFRDSEGSIFDKINTLLSARRIPIKQFLQIKHSDPAETFNLGKWILYAPVFQGAIEDDEAIRIEQDNRIKAFEDAEKSQRSYLWSRPQPPGMIFITLAYLSWLLLASPLKIIS